MQKEDRVEGQDDIAADVWDGLWRFLASIKLTVVVLLLMAALSIIGTLIPQNQSHADYLKAFGPFKYQVLNTLDIFDMYHSWWFQLLMVTLVVNIVVCSIDRLRITGKIIFTKNPSFNLNGFRRRPSRQNFSASDSPQGLKDVYLKMMARNFRYCRVVPVDQGYAITAEKGRWTRLGVYVVHASIVLLLMGAVVGSIFGFDAYVNIPEGEATSTIYMRNTGQEYQLPFAIRCDDFDLQKYDNGDPREYRSELVILENGKPSVQKAIIVNDPLRYKGINIFQSSFGPLDAPAPAPVTELPEEFELHFQSTSSGMVFTSKAALGRPVELPEGLGSFVAKEFQPAAAFKGMTVGPAVIGILTTPTGDAQEVLLPLQYPNFDKMRQGKTIISLGKEIMVPKEPIKERYYTGLQVTKDPGVGLVYTGFSLMIIGCIVTFFMAHQQVVVEVQPKDNSSAVMVSGTTNKHKVGFQNRLQLLTEKLEGLSAL